MSSGGVLSWDAGSPPVFAHLDRLTDERGLFEHALFATPRREHGYCVDDVARGLVVVSREPQPGPMLRRLGKCYLDFVLDAVIATGTCHNRMAVDGRWQDEPGAGDWWGRALWGLGQAAETAPTAGRRARALAGFRIAAQHRAVHTRSMAFAALGAAALLRRHPDEVCARALLVDVVSTIGSVSADRTWPWPEPRLTYANSALAEALILAGHELPDPQALADGLTLLDFLLRIQTRDGHLSVVPAAGRDRGEEGPGFDQQPIEVAALVDACATAHRITGDAHWSEGIRLGWAWFEGDNDASTSMSDVQTGAGYDGLLAAGRNLNQGAESTLAMLSVAQHARTLSGSQ